MIKFGHRKMMVRCLLCIGLHTAFPQQALALSAQEVFQKAAERVLVMDMLDANSNPVSSAGAMAIDSSTAVAQCDVLQGAAAIRLVREGKAYPAELKGGDREGLCVLNVPGLEVPGPLAGTQGASRTGARVFAVSNALGLGLSISEGIVAGTRELAGRNYVHFTAAIAPGSEGGGLFDEDGRLVGLITYRVRDGQNVNFAVPVQRLADIEKRLSSATVTQERSARAAVLAKEGNWQSLARHASQWQSEDAESSEAWAWTGYAAQQSVDWPAAEQAYREAVKREPSSIDLGVALAAVLLQQGKAQEVVELTRSLLNVRQEDARIWVVLGLGEMAQQRPAQAKQAFQRAVELDPWNVDAHQVLGRMARDAGDWPAAVAAHRALARIMPADVGTWMALADAYLLAQRPQRALSSIEEALRLAPDSGDAHLIRGTALGNLRRYKESILEMKRAIALKPSRLEWAWERLGGVYYDMKMYPEAIDAYQHALKLRGDSDSIKRGLGLALKDGLRFPEALAIFEQLKAEHPEDPFPWRQIGYVHGYLAEPDKAIPPLQRSLQLDSKQTKVWQALIETYHVAGRLDEMKRAYEQLRTIDAQVAETVYQRMLLPYEGNLP